MVLPHVNHLAGEIEGGTVAGASWASAVLTCALDPEHSTRPHSGMSGNVSCA